MICASAQAEEVVRPPDLSELARQTALLHEVADLWDANLAKIKTWEGEAAITRVSVNQDGDGERTEQAVAVTFVCDRTSDQLLWTRTEGPIAVTALGKTSHEQPVTKFESGWQSPTTLTRFSIHRSKKQEAQLRHAIILPREGERLAYYHDFDPIWYISYSGENAAQRMRFLAKVLQRPDAKWRVGKFGETVIVEYDNDGLINRYAFRLDWGGMPASYEGISPNGSDVVKWTFARQGDVWLPTEWSELSTQKRDEQEGDEPGPKVRSLGVKFVKNRLNEKLAADAFDLRHLGLEPGDSIYDKATDEHRKYQPEPVRSDAALAK